MSDAFDKIRNALRRQVGAPEIGPLERFGMGAPTPAPQPMKEANFSGSERVAQALRGVLGNSPTAERFIGGVSPVVSAFTTDVYDDARNVAQGGNPAMLAMALMPGAKGVGKAAQTAAKNAPSAAKPIMTELEALQKGIVVSNNPAPMPSFSDLMAKVPTRRKIGTPEEEAARKAELAAQIESLRAAMAPKQPGKP